LPTGRSVGPSIEDFGSIFFIDSTLTDLIEPSFLEKQCSITGVLIVFLAALYGPYLLMMPLILVFTVMRIVANTTCRYPIWPDAIERISSIENDAPYAESCDGTPVGWCGTILAQQRGEYPNDPKTRVAGLTGQSDGGQHALTWLDEPPTYTTQITQ
jgi:hypothetical protein